MSVTSTQSASVQVNGLNPALGPGMTLLANPSFAVNAAVNDDYLAETYTVNPSTTQTAVDLGKIVTGAIVWVQTDSPVTVTLTQTSGNVSIIVNTFLYLNSAFTAMYLANSNSTAAAHVAILVVGNRATLGSSPGVY